MEILTEEHCSGLSLDHLGLILDKIEELGLISEIDAYLPITSGRGSKVSMGERVAAMILNGLGFVDNRLYMFPEFLSKRPVRRLFGKELEAEWFNDDALGRCLDAIADYGTTKLFTQLSFSIGRRKKLLGRSAHFDTSTLQVYGEYAGEADETTPQPARGYSKSKRHDLKQMVLTLATTGKAAFPVWMESHSGNESDKKILPDAARAMHELCKNLSDVDNFIYVGDLAMYSNILEHSSEMKWLSRVPETVGASRQLLESEEHELNWQELEGGYRYHVSQVNYKDVAQRWVLVYSEQSYRREEKTLNKRIAQEGEHYQKQWWHLSNERFSCHDDAVKEAIKLEKAMKYHEATYQLIEEKGHGKRGRPSATAQPEVKAYRVQFTLTEKKEAIALAKRRKGRFILSTNELDSTNKLPDAEVLREYKAQSGTKARFQIYKR